VLEESADIQTRHKIYDKWVDLRPDHQDSTPINPESTRSEFDSLTSKISKLRAEIVAAVEAQVLAGK